MSYKPKVSGYRWKTNIPEDLGGGFGYSYASHWSTGPKDAEKLIRLSDHEASRAADKARIKDMERLLRKIHSDLLMRAEIETDGAKVINLSNGLWCRVAALAQQGKGGVK